MGQFESSFKLTHYPLFLRTQNACWRGEHKYRWKFRTTIISASGRSIVPSYATAPRSYEYRCDGAAGKPYFPSVTA